MRKFYCRDKNKFCPRYKLHEIHLNLKLCIMKRGQSDPDFQFRIVSTAFVICSRDKMEVNRYKRNVK